MRDKKESISLVWVIREAECGGWEKRTSINFLTVSKNHPRSASSVSRSWNTRNDSCTHSRVSCAGSPTLVAVAEVIIWNTFETSRRLKV